MTLKQIEYFLTIAETGNMSKAAKLLNISQPPLSLQLRSLEEELGVQLFKREKKRLIITANGELLEKRAKQIINLVNDTVEDMQSCSDERMTINLGTIHSCCTRLLPQRIFQFIDRFPYVDFNIYEGSTTNTLERLEKGEIDIGIVREPFNTSLYECVPVVDEALADHHSDYFMALAREEYFDDRECSSIPLADLKNKPLIVHRRYIDMLLASCRHKGFIPHIVCRNNDVMSSLGLAIAGVGIALLPYTSVLLNNSPELTAKFVTQPVFNSQICVVWKGSGMTRELASFIKLFREDS